MGLVVGIVCGRHDHPSGAVALADAQTGEVLMIVRAARPFGPVRLDLEAQRDKLRIVRCTLLGRIPEIGEVLPAEVVTGLIPPATAS